MPTTFKHWFDECSICLSKMIVVSKKHNFVGVNIRKLSCGHTFHKTCIAAVLKHRHLCPICQSYVYTAEEAALLKKKTITSSDVQYLATIPSERAMVLLKDAVKMGLKMLIEAICAIFDPTEVVHHYIIQNNVEALLQLVYSKWLNWHRTYNGKTLVDAAAEADEPLIGQIVTCIAAQKSCST